MRRGLGWNKKDPELGKLEIEARIFGDKLTFHRQRARFEEWEEFKPTDEDWDVANMHALNKFNRGKLQERHLKVFQARGRKGIN